VQPLIVPEYRWHVVFTRNYGGQPTAVLDPGAGRRHLASHLAGGRARSVIVDGDEHMVDAGAAAGGARRHDHADVGGGGRRRPPTWRAAAAAVAAGQRQRRGDPEATASTSQPVPVIAHDHRSGERQVTREIR
jgi:hypothetical protein